MKPYKVIKKNPKLGGNWCKFWSPSHCTVFEDPDRPVPGLVWRMCGSYIWSLHMPNYSRECGYLPCGFYGPKPDECPLRHGGILIIVDESEGNES